MNPADLPKEPSIPSALGDSVLNVAGLARLANQFFSALPNESVASAQPLNLPAASAQSAPSPGSFGTSAFPTEAELSGILNQNSFGGAPAVTQNPAARSSTPSFYFLNGLGAPPPSPPQVSAQHFPTDVELGAIVGQGSFAKTLPGGVPSLPPPSASAPSFYFVPNTRSAGPGGSATPGHAPMPPAEASKPQGFRPEAASSDQVLDVHLLRQDFPILRERVNGRPLIWLDNAATTQKPQSVIDRLRYFYEHENSNIHRAAHELAARATDAYESAREKVRAFLNASSTNEIVFTRGCTEAINLVAQTWGRQHIGKDDEIVLSMLEHHANIVPWQQLCAEKGAKLKVIPVDDDGQILLDEYRKLLGGRTKLVSFSQVSNALGTITPAALMTQMAHAFGAKVLLDGAQSVSHMRVDMQSLDCDFFTFSGHKVFGPTGIGALYGKEALLNSMPPWQGGGNMIKDVTFEHTEYQNAPLRFEAGTGNIADAVGLGAALDYVTSVGIDNIDRYEHALLEYGTHQLKQIPGLRLIGTAPTKASVLSFVIDGFKTEEIGAALNREGIAVRSGHHCAQPILRRFGLETSVRPSLAFYNTHAEIDAMTGVLRRLHSGQASLR